MTGLFFGLMNEKAQIGLGFETMPTVVAMLIRDYCINLSEQKSSTRPLAGMDHAFMQWLNRAYIVADYVGKGCQLLG